MLVSTELKLRLTGGTANLDPSFSLGGDSASQLISTNPVNNLFDDVLDKEAEVGLTDYRCVSLSNSSVSDTLDHARVYLLPKTTGGSLVSVGALFQTEQQKIVVSGNLILGSGNSFTLTYSSPLITGTAIVFYAGSVTGWASNLQGALNSIVGLEGVTVTGSSLNNTAIFVISFLGTSNFKSHPLLQVSHNSIPGARISVDRLQEGSPINSTPSIVDSVISPPIGIQFITPTETDPLVVGALGPGEFFPIWVERNVAPNSSFPSDGFSLVLKGSPTLPAPVGCGNMGTISYNVTASEPLNGGTAYITQSQGLSFDVSQLALTTKIMLPGARSDDFVLFVGENDTVSQSYTSPTGPVTFKLPSNYIIWRDTFGWLQTTGKSTQKTFIDVARNFTHVIAAGSSLNNGNGHVIDVEAGGFSTRPWTDGFTKEEAVNFGWVVNNKLKFKIVHIACGQGTVSLNDITCQFVTSMKRKLEVAKFDNFVMGFKAAETYRNTVEEPKPDRQFMDAKLEHGKDKKVLFLPFQGEVGWFIMHAVRLVYFNKAAYKIACIKPGQECLFPNVDEFYYDWKDVVPDELRSGTHGGNVNWDEIIYHYPDATPMATGNISDEQEFMSYDLDHKIPVKPKKAQGLQVDVCIGVRNRSFLPDKNYKHWQFIADKLRNAGLTYAVIAASNSGCDLHGQKYMSGDYGWDGAIELLQNCKLFIGTDSGGGHLASIANGCPMIVQRVPDALANTTRSWIERMKQTTTHKVVEVPAHDWDDPDTMILEISKVLPLNSIDFVNFVV